MIKISTGFVPNLVVFLLLIGLFASSIAGLGATAFLWIWLATLTLVVILVYRLDPLNIITVYWAPWLLMLAMSLMDISEFHRGISLRTATLVISSLLAGAVVLPASAIPIFDATTQVHTRIRAYNAVGCIFLAFCILNVGLAGYVPLIQLFTEGDSGYVDFGVKGLYGLFNAFANAFGVTSFFLWQTTRKPVFRNYFLLVVAAFLLFVTRQNVISLIIECFVVYSLGVRRIKIRTLIVGLIVLLVGFSILGDLRQASSMDIVEAAKIYPEFAWLPNVFIWVYSYFYFNLLNLDNIVTLALPPTYDGTSLHMFIPSFLRPINEASGAALEVSYFTANPFISVIYQDAGVPGVMVVIGIFGYFTRQLLVRMRGKTRLFALGSYSTLFFCFFFSFFENFFFYLPIIAQVGFFWIFERFFLRIPYKHGAGPDSPKQLRVLPTK